MQWQARRASAFAIRLTFNQSAVVATLCRRTPKGMGSLSQRDLYRLISEATARRERVVMATVAHTRGSTPQQRGAKMLFFENGEVAGTVGGGCIEAEVWAEAREAMRSGNSALHHFSLTAEEASEEGMVCGGTMEIFIDTIRGKTDE